MRRGLALLGGIERFVQPGERLLLKPNILAGEPSESAVTTHPAVLAAAVTLLREAGAQVVFGDSPGLERAAHAADRSGLREAGERAGAEWGDFSGGGPLANTAGSMEPSFHVAREVHRCDGLVNLPKAKAHQLTRITAAVKNTFGCIPGQRKAMVHVRYPDVQVFSRYLAELGLALRPRLHVLDAIVAMEGNGPRSGDPRPLNALVLSTDPVAVDATLCRMIAMDPADVPTNTAGAEAGYGHWREAEVDLVGEALAPLVQPDFRVVRAPVFANTTLSHYALVRNLLLPRPAIDADRCVGCGRCVEACPVPGKALRWQDGARGGVPVYDDQACIRCYCCQEMCPRGAIGRKRPWLGRLLRVA